MMVPHVAVPDFGSRRRRKKHTLTGIFLRRRQSLTKQSVLPHPLAAFEGMAQSVWFVGMQCRLNQR